MARDSVPAVAYISQCLDYNRKTGVHVWRTRPVWHFVTGNRTASWNCNAWNSRYAGKIAGTLRPDGYTKITIDCVHYLGHILAWVIDKGVWPKGEIDHRNFDRADNRIKNLRDALPVQNKQNGKKRSTNTSGFKGVSWRKDRGYWGAYDSIDGKTRYLGGFSTAEEAYAAYCRAARKAHGKFFNPG